MAQFDIRPPSAPAIPQSGLGDLGRGIGIGLQNMGTGIAEGLRARQAREQQAALEQQQRDAQAGQLWLQAQAIPQEQINEAGPPAPGDIFNELSVDDVRQMGMDDRLALAANIQRNKSALAGQSEAVEQGFKIEDQLRGELQSDPFIDLANQVYAGVADLEQLWSRDDGKGGRQWSFEGELGAEDYAAVVKLVRTVEAGGRQGVITQDDITRVSGAAGTPEEFAGKIMNLIGAGKFTGKTRRDFMAAMHKLLQSAHDRARPIVERYQAMAEDRSNRANVPVNFDNITNYGREIWNELLIDQPLPVFQNGKLVPPKSAEQQSQATDLRNAARNY